MNRWQEQFDEHPIHQTLEQLNEWLNVELDDLGDGDTAEIRRCKNVLELIFSTIKELDVELIPFQQLDGLNSQLRQQTIWNQLSAFGSNKQIQYVVTTNDNLSPVIQYLTWLVPYTNIQGHDESLSSLRTTVDQTVDALAAKKEQLNSELNDLYTKLDEVTARKDQLESTIEQRRQEVDQQVSQWQQQFSDAQEKRADSYNDWRNKVESEIKTESQSLVDATQSQVESLEKSTNEEITQILSDTKEKHQEIKDLFQLASGDSISGGYSQFADKERFQSHLWRAIAVLFIGLTAWWIFSAYGNLKPSHENSAPTVTVNIEAKVETKESETKIDADNKPYVNPTSSNFDWHKFLLSFSLTGVLLFGAGYAGQQSNRHRENEKRMRWFALQIKALDPYINSLDPEDQKELKKTLSEKFFNGAYENEAPQGMVDEHAISVVAKTITDAIKAAKA